VWGQRAFTIERSTGVLEQYQILGKHLQTYYQSLAAGLRANAPELISILEPPKPPQHGYQILPTITANAPLPAERPRAQSARYSWPWTDQLIDNSLKEILRAEKELNRAGALSLTARRSIYEKLAHGYQTLRERQRNIDAHIQYNRLWQAAIAANRSGYDRETILHDEVLERQAIANILQAMGDAAFKQAPAGSDQIGPSYRFADVTTRLLDREKQLARDIRNATAPVVMPTFVRVEQRVPRLWILHVPFYTDIDNQDFVDFAKSEIEKLWHLRDAGDEFRVKLTISYMPGSRLYKERLLPQRGDKVAYEHLDLFPSDGAILTTGALTTHVYGRAIVLGPHDISPRVLAHEFGHVLGFKDAYFRGYKDLGKDGFQVMEVVAEPDDIMGAAGTGAVLRSHFERLLESTRKKIRATRQSVVAQNRLRSNAVAPYVNEASPTNQRK
jgi:hypothetical protein